MADECGEVLTARFNCDSFSMFTRRFNEDSKSIFHVEEKLFAQGGRNTLFQCKPIPEEKRFEITATTTIGKESSKKGVAGKDKGMTETRIAKIPQNSVIKDISKNDEENSKKCDPYKVKIYCAGVTVFTKETENSAGEKTSVTDSFYT